MRVDIEHTDDKEKEGAVIRITEMTENIKGAMELLEGGSGSIMVSKGDTNLLLNKSRIYYIESVDKKTFVYTKVECFD